MSDYAYPLKDRQIKLYYAKNVTWKNAHAYGTYQEKKYVHPKDESLRAYVRQIVANNQENSDAVIIADRYLVVINYRDLPRGQYYVEWKNKVLKVLNIDEFEGRNLELKLECQVIDTDPLANKVIRDQRWKS